MLGVRTPWVAAPLVVAAVLVVSPLAASGDGSSGPGHVVSQAVRARGERLTTELTQLSIAYQVAPGGRKPRLEQDLLAAAQSRRQILRSLLDADPSEMLRLVIPSQIRAGLPASAQRHVEEETDVEGDLEVLHQDDATGGRYIYTLEAPRGRLSLRFAGDEPDDLMTGTRVRAKGFRLDNVLALEGASTGSIQPLTTALPNTFGEQRTLVILVNFTDKATQPYTVEWARSVVFTTTSNFKRENSYGQTWLSGDVAGWYTIPMTSTVCDYYALANHARQAAAAGGVNVSAYTRHVFAFPKNACGWWGLGSVGGNPSSAWVNGTLSLAVIGHELGHNLGLRHSHSYDCGTTVLGPTCAVSDYGDTLDIMGSSSRAHFNAFQKERLGWLNYGSSPPVATVSGSGTYTIRPYASATRDLKGLKIVQSTNPLTGKRTWYYLEYRQGLGFDSVFASNLNVTRGLVVHLGTEANGNTSYLLDMTPATVAWSDPALGVGLTYEDRDAGVTITPMWADASGIGVSVAFRSVTCMRGKPTVTMSPSESQWLPAGATARFTVSVTNNDNQGCTASTFTLQGVVPAGWNGVLGTTQLSVNPGATASTTVTVASPSSVVPGFYTVGVNAADGSSEHGGSATATYVVTSSLDTSITTDKTTYSRPSAVNVAVAVRVNGAAVAGAAVTVSVTDPSGAVAKQTATTGATGVAVFKFGIKKHDRTGLYQAVSTATAGPGVTGQASATFRVQ